jgi:hypothetical protein
MDVVVAILEAIVVAAAVIGLGCWIFYRGKKIPRKYFVGIYILNG